MTTGETSSATGSLDRVSSILIFYQYACDALPFSKRSLSKQLLPYILRASSCVPRRKMLYLRLLFEVKCLGRVSGVVSDVIVGQAYIAFGRRSSTR